MEKALFIGSNFINIPNGFDLFYVGEEFCDTYFVHIFKDIIEEIKLIGSSKRITLVVPIINEFNKICYKLLLESCSSPLISEIVCNDIGTLYFLLNNKYENCIAGRILSRYLYREFLSQEKDENLTCLLNSIKRFELDQTGLHTIGHFINKKITYVKNNIYVGFFNNRCVYRKTDIYNDKQICEMDCMKGHIEIIENRYLDGNYLFYHNAVLKETETNETYHLADRQLIYLHNHFHTSQIRQDVV